MHHEDDVENNEEVVCVPEDLIVEQPGGEKGKIEPWQIITYLILNLFIPGMFDKIDDTPNRCIRGMINIVTRYEERRQWEKQKEQRQQKKEARSEFVQDQTHRLPAHSLSKQDFTGQRRRGH